MKPISLLSVGLFLLFVGCHPVAASSYQDDDDIGPRTLRALKITELRMNDKPQNCIDVEKRYELVRRWKFDLIHVFEGGHGFVWQSQISGNIMLTYDIGEISCVIGTGKSKL